MICHTTVNIAPSLTFEPHFVQGAIQVKYYCSSDGLQGCSVSKPPIRNRGGKWASWKQKPLNIALPRAVLSKLWHHFMPVSVSVLFQIRYLPAAPTDKLGWMKMTRLSAQTNTAHAITPMAHLLARPSYTQNWLEQAPFGFYGGGRKLCPSFLGSIILQRKHGLGVIQEVSPCQKEWNAIYAFLCLINHLLPYLKTWSQNDQPEQRDGHFAFGRTMPESFTEQVPIALLTVCHVIHHAKLNQQGVKRWLWELLSERSDYFIKEAGQRLG